MDNNPSITIRYIDLFCGIGGFRLGVDQVNAKYGFRSKCVFSSDIDDGCRLAYHANFNEVPSGDIKQIDEKSIPDHDLLLAGFPCQPFSIIGTGKGFDDTRGTLFFDIARIINEKKPKAFILENVKRLASHNNGETLKKILRVLKDIGYSVDFKILNALDYGLPQKRERIFIVGFYKPMLFLWPDKRSEYIPLSKILETNVTKKYFASDGIKAKRQQLHRSKFSPSIWHENKSGNICSYPYSCALRAEASYNYLLVDGERRLTPREMLRLQGFPESYKIVVSDSQLRKQAGNAVPVNLVSSVFESLVPVIMDDLSVMPSFAYAMQNPLFRLIKDIYGQQTTSQVTHS